MTQIFQAPMGSVYSADELSIFLAGSIEMGAAENWQQTAICTLEGLPVKIFNPRRDDWDSSWVQDIKNPQFYEQVNWELSHLERAKIKFFYFAPGTMSPITLAELGFVLGLHRQYVSSTNGESADKIYVVCPEGYERRGSVQIS